VAERCPKRLPAPISTGCCVGVRPARFEFQVPVAWASAGRQGGFPRSLVAVVFLPVAHCFGCGAGWVGWGSGRRWSAVVLWWANNPVIVSVPAESWVWHSFRDGPRRRVSEPMVDHGRRVLILVWFGFCGRI
jgi:hypothetical protein